MLTRLMCFTLQSLLGFIFVNLERRRALSSMAPAPAGDNSAQRRQMDPARRAEVLRSFYRSTVGAVFPDTFVPTPHAVDQNGGESDGSF